MDTKTPSTPDQRSITKKIWLTSYMYALTHMDPAASCETANNAVAIYIEKWGLLTAEQRQHLSVFKENA